MAEYAQRKIYCRNCLLSIAENRQNVIKNKVFKILVCPEFYISKEPRQFEIYEAFRAEFVMKRWRKWVATQVQNKQNAEKVENWQKRRFFSKYLRIWRTQLFLQQITQKVALPYFEGLQQKLKL